MAVEPLTLALYVSTLSHKKKDVVRTLQTTAFLLGVAAACSALIECNNLDEAKAYLAKKMEEWEINA